GHHELHSFVDVCSPAGARRLAEIRNGTSGVAWDKGGQEIVFASTSTPVITPEHIWSVSVRGGQPVDRTPNLAGTAATLVGDPRGTIWVEMHKGVTTEVDTYKDGKLETAFRWPDGTIPALPVYPLIASAPSVLAFTVGDPAHSANVAVNRGGQLQKVTHEGDDDVLANVSLGDVKAVHWSAKDGTKLEGIATFPADYAAGKKYPFLVLPHGGPEANDELRFDVFARLVSGLGYIVLQPEYRGSTGYGADFLSAIYQHFGDRAYSDVDSATDFAIAQGWA